MYRDPCSNVSSFSVTAFFLDAFVSESRTSTTWSIVIIIIVTVAATTTTTATAAGCDRECLRGFVTQYIDAMAAQNPGALPVTANVRFTENNEEIKLGEGLWQNFTRLTDYRRDILDVRDGVAVSFMVLEGDPTPVLYVIRLKIDNNRVSEIETMTVRNREEGMLYYPDNLRTPRPLMLSEVPVNQRVSREEAIRIALTYPEGLRVGSFVTVDSPMADDAYRYENGQLMAGPGCTFFPNCEIMKTQMIPTLPEVTDRIIAVDEELGIVAMRMNFGRGSLFDGNGVLDVWHSFKIYDGLIHAAEAYCKAVPEGQTSGWD
jgi:hypothetical protein